jgi:hypothetical protein
MEVAEIISHHIDKVQNLIVVEFKLFDDEDDFVREDFIEYSVFEEFGFSEDNKFSINEEYDDEDYEEWDDDGFDYFYDENKLISFLNEYYVIFPKRLPKAQIK